MYYSNIEDCETDFLINNFVINDNSAKQLLEEFKTLKKNIIEYKKSLKNLINQKETYENYSNNLLNNHLNIVNIINNVEKINNSFNEYQINVKENYENWINNHYNIQYKSIEENIEITELKIKEYTNLFIYIINNILNEKEISKNICPICFENEIDICFNPCGHTICNKCVFTHKNNKCFTCRSPINDYLKIYFSL